MIIIIFKKGSCQFDDDNVIFLERVRDQENEGEIDEEGRTPEVEVSAGKTLLHLYVGQGARCSSVVRAFAHGAMGCRIDPSWGGPIELFCVPPSAPRLV